MANYTQSTFFGPKDALTPGDPLKKIKGTDIDAELAAVVVAIASKADNAGPTSSFTSLTDPGADRIPFWDDSASAFDWLNPIGSNSGLTIAGTNMTVDITGLSDVGTLLGAHSFMVHNGTGLRKTTIGAISHDILTDFVANEHINHSTISITAGTGLSGGGDITATRTLDFTPAGLLTKASPTVSDFVVITDASLGGGPPRIAQLATMVPAIQGAIVSLPVANGGTGASTAATARANLGLVINADVQAYDADLAAMAAIVQTDGNFIVANGTTWVGESGATARTSLGLGSIATRNVTVSTSAPSGGSDGDFWFVREA